MRLFNVLFVTWIALSGCTRPLMHKQNPKIDADGFMGALSTNYLHVDSTSKATVISIAGDEKSAKKLVYQASTGVVDMGDIPLSQIILSLEKKYLTLVGSYALFELIEAKPEEITPNYLANTQGTLETLCITSPLGNEMGTTGFQEIQFKTSNGMISTVGLKASGVQTLGTATREDQSSMTIYHVQNFGDFLIDLTRPLPTNPQYFLTQVTNPAWSTANNVYCHQDRVVGHQVFVTSSQYRGSLGGIEGADQKCQHRAEGAHLEGTWKAILSDGVVHARDRINVQGPITVMGTTNVIAINAATLWDGSINFAIDRNERGDLVQPSNLDVWTGTSPSGVSLGIACLNWTSNEVSEDGQRGNGQNTNGGWISTSVDDCSSSKALYCISQ